MWAPTKSSCISDSWPLLLSFADQQGTRDPSTAELPALPGGQFCHFSSREPRGGMTGWPSPHWPLISAGFEEVAISWYPLGPGTGADNSHTMTQPCLGAWLLLPGGTSDSSGPSLPLRQMATHMMDELLDPSGHPLWGVHGRPWSHVLTLAPGPLKVGRSQRESNLRHRVTSAGPASPAVSRAQSALVCP